jgi:hypothetical protein
MSGGANVFHCKVTVVILFCMQREQNQHGDGNIAETNVNIEVIKAIA